MQNSVFGGYCCVGFYAGGAQASPTVFGCAKAALYGKKGVAREDAKAQREKKTVRIQWN